jgi:WD40 repeat protein/HEAT repeat protein
VLNSHKEDIVRQKKLIAGLVKTGDGASISALRRIAELAGNEELRSYAKKALLVADAADSRKYISGEKQRIVKLLKEGNRDSIFSLRHIADFAKTAELRFYARKALHIAEKRLSFNKKNSGLSEKNEDFALCVRLKKLIDFEKYGSFDELVPYLSHKNPRVRASAIEVLSLRGDVHACPFFIKALSDDDNRVRANALLALRRLEFVDTADILKEMCNSSEVATRSSVAFILRFFPPMESEEMLLELVKDSSRSVRRVAADSLSHVSGGLEDFDTCIDFNDISEFEFEVQQEDVLCQELKKELENSDQERRRQAVKKAVIGCYGAVELLEVLIQEKDDCIRADILTGLGRMQYKDAVPVLYEHLSDPSSLCRVGAVEAFRLMNWTEKIPEAKKFLSPLLKDKDPFVKTSVILALKDTEEFEVYDCLRDMVVSSDKSVQMNAIYIIMELDDIDCYYFLTDLSVSVHSEVRNKVAYCQQLLFKRGITLDSSYENRYSSRVFRIFVSSTFNDLKNERNALQERVFPRLKELCLKYNYRFQAIDLRWGIPDEANLDQKTMRICLDEIKRCQKVSPRPNFLVLLGDRYGWLPPPEEIPFSEFQHILDFCRSNQSVLEGELTVLLSGAWKYPSVSEFLLYWYKCDYNYSNQNSGKEAVWVLQPRSGDYALYENKEIWAPVEQALVYIMQQATVDFPENRRDFYQSSATAQEILHGALMNTAEARKHVFCFFRRIEKAEELLPEFVKKDSKALTYFDTLDGGFNRYSQGRLNELKRRLYMSFPHNVFDYNARWCGDDISYSHIDKLCENVYQSLSSVIMERIGKDREIDSLGREISNQEKFLIERAGSFIGRQEYLDFISDYINSSICPDKSEKIFPLLITGCGGSGKSALIARAAMNSKNSSPVYRFVGATPESSDIERLLKSICHQIIMDRQLSLELPEEYEELEKFFPELLEMASARKPLIIFIDALDQLSAFHRADEMRWLPSELPSTVRLVISSLELDEQDLLIRQKETEKIRKTLFNLHLKVPLQNRQSLQKMSLSEGEKLLDCWLDEDHRSLTVGQKRLILENFQKNGNPLYLKIAFEESRRWRSYTSEAEIQLSPDLEGIIRSLFIGLSSESAHGSMVVSGVVSALAASRNGLSEDEILDILASDDEFYKYISTKFCYHDILPAGGGKRQIPVAIWSRFYSDISPYLTERFVDGSCLMTFFHRHFQAVSDSLYLCAEAGVRAHKLLARYFLNQKLYLHSDCPNIRKCSELPFQLYNAGMYVWLDEALSDPDFIAAKCKSGMSRDLLSDYALCGICTLQLGPPVLTVREHNGDYGVLCPLCRNSFAVEWSSESEKPMDFICPGCQKNYYLNSFFIPSPTPLSFQSLAHTSRSFASSQSAVFSHFPAIHHLSSQHYSSLTSVSTFEFSDVLYDFAHFVRAGIHVFSSCPEAFFQQILNEPYTSLHYVKAKEKIGNKPYICWLNRPKFKSPELMTLKGHSAQVRCCAFSFSGRLVVSGANDKTVRLWDTDSGSELLSINAHEGPILACAFSPDDCFFASASADGLLKLWDSFSGDCRMVFRGHGQPVNDFAFFPDGSLLVSASSDYSLNIWEVSTGRIINSLKAHKDRVSACSVSPDGRFIISAGSDDFLILWDATSGKEIQRFSGHEYEITDCVFSPDMKLFASTDAGGILKVWDIKTGLMVKSFTAHSASVSCCGFSPDGKILLSASCDKTIRFRESVNDVGEPVNKSEGLYKGVETAVFSGHGGFVECCNFSSDGRFLVSASADFTLKIWDASFRHTEISNSPHVSFISCCGFSLDGRKFLSGSRDGDTRIWDIIDYDGLIADSAPYISLDFCSHSEPVLSCDLSPDGELAVISADEMRVYELKSGRVKHKLSGWQGHDGLVNSCVFSPDGSKILSGGTDNTLKLWTMRESWVSSFKRVEKTFTGHEAPVSCVAFSSDGKKAVSASFDQTLNIWDIECKNLICTLYGHESVVNCCAFSPDGRTIVSCSDDKSIRLWDVESGEEKFCLNGHVASVSACGFSPDGLYIISVSTDKTIRFWDAFSGLQSHIMHTASPLSCLNINKKNGLIAVGAHGGEVLFLRLENGYKQE